MKKKIIALCLIVALAATAVIGGTLAYFTDTKEVTNTFTVGGVAINLIEQERDGKGGLQAFTQNQCLMPIVGSAQGDKDAQGQPVAENYIDKMVTIENTGKSDAWVRAYFAIPSALDNGYETFNAGLNILHFNFGNKDGVSTEGVQWKWTHDSKWNYFETTIDGVSYNVYFADYYQPLEADETTAQLLSGVYLDKSFDAKDGKYYAFNKEVNLSGLINADGVLKVSCPVKAVAVQADGFDNAAAAVDAAFGEHFNPFGGTATNWQ